MDGVLCSKVKLLSGEQALQVVRELNRWLDRTTGVTWVKIQNKINDLVERVLQG